MKCLLICFFIGFTLSCTDREIKSSPDDLEQLRLSNEKREESLVIYNLVFDDIFKDAEQEMALGDKEAYLIADRTDIYLAGADERRNETLYYLQQTLKRKSVNRDSFRNFMKENEEPEDFAYLPVNNKKCVLANKQEMRNLLEEDSRGNLHKKYPKFRSLIYLSKIGFDMNKTSALVYMAYQRGVKSGAGNYYLLVKEGGSWKIKEKIGDWVA